MSQATTRTAPRTFDTVTLQKVIAQVSGIHGPLASQLNEISHALFDAPSKYVEPIQRGIAVRAVRDLTKALGFGSPSTMTDLFIDVIDETTPDPEEAAFQRVRLRSIGAEERLMAEEGGMLSDAEFADTLGVRSRSTVQNYREQNRIFSVPQGVRNHRYPAWQIHRKALLPGLPEVLAVLVREHSLDPFNVALFFLTKADALEDERPLDLLRRGEIDEVVAHAHRYANQA